MVLAIDVERERISLGIKQLDGDRSPRFTPRSTTAAAVVTGKVKSGRPRGAEIQLERRRHRLPAGLEISRDRVETRATC